VQNRRSHQLRALMPSNPALQRTGLRPAAERDNVGQPGGSVITRRKLDMAGVGVSILTLLGLRSKAKAGLSTERDLSFVPQVDLLQEARRTGPLVSAVLSSAARLLRPGVTTDQLHAAIEKGLAERDLGPAMKGYNGYPFSATFSVNEEVLHGLPSSRRLAAGDIVKIETGSFTGRGFASQGWTFPVGNVSAADSRLLATATRALRAAQATIRTGARAGDIGHAIQTTVEAQGLVVVRQFVGYGMGARRIQAPMIPGYGTQGRGAKLREGQILNVHVILKAGSPDVSIAEDGWTAVASDGNRGALKSCMMEVDAGGCRLLGRFLDPP
jgi:methionyl aminopeptidase